MSRFVLTAQLQLQAPNNVAQVVRQIQNQLNNVSVNVQVQGSAQAQRQLQQITAQTNTATSAADRMGRAFAVSIRRFAAFSIATRAVGLFTSTLSDAIKSAIDFEREMVRVSQVTGEALSNLRSFSKTVTTLSTNLGVASSDLVQAGQLLLQAGISAKDTEVALRTLAKAALAPNFDSLSETTEGAIAILAQFGQGVGALEKQLGAINAVAGAFAVEAGDLIDVIRRAGGVFKSSGGDLNELIALFTSVRATTRESAESIGTGLRTIFTRIQRPKTIEFLKQFGVELVDLNGKFVGPFEAVQKLSSALAGLGEGDITFIRIAEELGGFRQIGKVLPLLQQFSTAQAALNVAQKSGNSLTKDAETAQQALAVRIVKVKEEFLALIRSITETSTFQIMANTALSLASALIKIGEAIKPLLPLLGTLAAVNLVRGSGTFFGGLMRGMQSGRTFSTGGKVHHFARGGIVPGSGNRDTVPAMLSPGEFVIRKSSVNKLGAGNLAAMNENRYNRGTEGRGIVGATKQLKSVEKRKSPYAPKESMPGSGMVKFNVNEGQIGAFVLQPAKGTEGSYTATKPYPFTLPPSNRYAQLAAKQAGLSPADISGGVNATINPASYPIFYPGMNEGRSNLQKNAKYAQAVTKGFNDAISTGVNSTIQSVTSQGLLDIPPAYNTNENLLRNTIASIQSDNQVRSSIEGYLFEGMISAFTGAQAAGGRANFDFPRSAISQNKDKLATLFGSGPMINKLIKAEAKRSYGEVGGNIQRKLANDIIAGYKGGVSIQTVGKKFATGGSVGTDTVPALLTPGEFVVNRSSAQRIGYGNLNRMNKVGRYANGGIVQRFQAGGVTATPARSRSNPNTVAFVSAQALAQQGNALKQNTQIVNQNTDAQRKSSRSAMDVVNNNKMFAASMGLSLIQGFLPAVDENSSAVLRMTHSLLGLATTITTVGFALEAFGVSLSIKSIAQLFGSGPGSIGGMLSTALKGFRGGTSFGGMREIAQAGPFAKGAFRLGGLLSKDISGGRLGSLTNLAPNFRQGFQFGAGSSYNTVFNSAKNAGTTARVLNKAGTFGQISAQVGGGLGNIAGKIGETGSFKNLISFTTKLGTNFKNTAGLALGVGLAFKAATTMVDAYTNYQEKLNRAIQKGNIGEARKNATEAAGADAVNSFGAGLISFGSIFGPPGVAVAALGAGLIKLGSEIPVLGSMIKTVAITAMRAFGGNTIASIEAFAASQAGAVKTQKELERAQQTATNAMQDFENGAITASDALLRIRASTDIANAQERRAGTAAVSNLENRAGGITGYFRDVFSNLTLGFTESSEKRNQRLGQQSAEQIRQATRFQSQAFQMETGARTAGIRSGFARGLSRDEIREQALGNRLGRMRQLNRQATELGRAGDLEGAEAAQEAFAQVASEVQQINRELDNLEKEVARAKAAFEAMNLGLRGPTATANAMSASMTKFAAGLEVGGDMFSANVEFLSQAVTGAAQAMDPNEIKKSVKGVRSSLESMGISPQFANKFETNANAFIQAQQNYNKSFEKIRQDLISRNVRGLSGGAAPDAVKKAFAEELTKGLGDDAKKNLTAIINGIELSNTEVDAIISGNFQVFGDKLSEAGQKQFEEILKIAQERQKAEQVLIQLTQQRIESERNFAAAQKEAVDLFMEGRDVQARFGGRAISVAERRSAVLARANAGAGGMGLSRMRTGNAAEIRGRNAQILGGFGAIEGRRRVEGGMQGAGGIEAQGIQQNLQQAQKDQIQTIRDLIKVEEEELKIIQEKNRMEKESLESLISGDIEKFFEQQAAVGAQAAIAAGDMDLAGMFGTQAIGNAFRDIQRQQEAGVQSLFGRQLGGQGGLAEQAARAALGSRGVTDPRMAQVLAGTTPEEEASKRRLRELGGLLGETGAIGAAMAEMQVQTAQINVANAQVELSQVEARGRQAAAGLYRGGMVYASNGMFIPRGTDTVPAMLTPGEFVVRREAVNRGNNLQVLRAINNGQTNATGLAKGGKVRYYNTGGQVQYKAIGDLVKNTFGIDPKIISTLGTVFNTFINGFNQSIKNLRDTKLQVKMDSVNVNVNLTGTSMLTQISQETKNKIIEEAVAALRRESSISNGRIVENRSNLPRAEQGQ